MATPLLLSQAGVLVHVPVECSKRYTYVKYLRLVILSCAQAGALKVPWIDVSPVLQSRSASPNPQACLLACPSASSDQAPWPVHHVEHHSGQDAYRPTRGVLVRNIAHLYLTASLTSFSVFVDFVSADRKAVSCTSSYS